MTNDQQLGEEAYFEDVLEIDEDDNKVPTANQMRPPTEAERDKWLLDKRWSLFMNPRMHGTCFNMWQFLKVDIFAKTNVCCTYFGRLPEFKFLNAKDFHGEEGMWNHPFMVHLRAKDGTKDEVPYCGFCQGRYRPDLPSRTARRLSIVESQKLLQDKMDEVVAFEYSGKIDTLDEDLSGWTFPLKRKNGYEWAPFKSKRQFYRRDVRLAAFQNIGKVALLGSSLAAYAPFLVEPNNQLSIVDWQKNQVANVRELLTNLDLTAESKLLDDGPLILPFDDESLSGIWLDAARWMERYDCLDLFAEIKRVLKPGGRLRAVRAPCSGTNILKAAHAETEEEVNSLIKSLENGADLGQRNVCFTPERVYLATRRLGFKLDKSRPPQIHIEGEAFRETPVLGRDLVKIAEQLRSPEFRKRLKNDTSLQTGLETAISFNASRI